MEKLLVMNEHNYDDNLQEIYRVSVRGIIFVAGRLLMIESSSGEIKLPGGGLESGEDAYKRSFWQKRIKLYFAAKK